VRAFVGIALPPEVRGAVAGAIGPLRGPGTAVSWVPTENLHITLKFLGEIPRDRCRLLEGLLSGVAAGSPPFSLDAAGGGAFPGTRNPRVLWVGFLEPLELVGKLQQNMENALSGAGFPGEDRRFHPHITVGRVRGVLPPAWGERFLQSLSGREFGQVPVSSLRLFESRLSPGGAIYRVVREFPLEGSPPAREDQEEIS
jgi:2'-5' RNA ligase